MNTPYKRRDIEERIARLEKAIQYATEYLKDGSHAEWSGFKPLFVQKYKDGQPQPPHSDWVKNVFLPNAEKELDKTERILERMQ